MSHSSLTEMKVQSRQLILRQVVGVILSVAIAVQCQGMFYTVIFVLYEGVVRFYSCQPNSFCGTYLKIFAGFVLISQDIRIDT